MEEASRSARDLMDSGLIACANILPGGISIYRWDGAVQTEPEIYALFKTKRAHFEAVQEKITLLHPYKIPCILAWDIVAGNPPYLEWVTGEVS